MRVIESLLPLRKRQRTGAVQNLAEDCERLEQREVVEVVALRQLRPREAGGTEGVNGPSCLSELRRSARRRFSQRENHHPQTVRLQSEDQRERCGSPRLPPFIPICCFVMFLVCCPRRYAPHLSGMDCGFPSSAESQCGSSFGLPMAQRSWASILSISSRVGMEISVGGV